MDVGMILLLLVGAVIGFYVGRWTTEYRRARFDMNSMWKSRSRYRR